MKQRQWKIWLVIVVWGGLMGLGMMGAARKLPGAYLHNDFYVYFLAGKLVRQGLTPYGVSEAFIHLKETYQLNFHWSTGYVYPPLLAYLMIPVTWIAPQTAVWIWFVCQLLLYGWWVGFIIKKWPSRWAGFFLLTFPPAIFSIASGQINTLVLWLFTIYVLTRKPKIAGMSLGFLGVMKVYPLVVLAGELARYRYKTVIYSGVFLGLLLALPIIFGSTNNTLNYFTRVLPETQGRVDGYFTHQSLSAVLTRLTSAEDKLGSVAKGSLITGSQLIVGIALIVYGTWWTRRQKSFGYREKIVWIYIACLAAGRMTYWNFLPTALGVVFLLHQRGNLSRGQRCWLYGSIGLSNVVWYGVHAWYFWLPVVTWWQRLGFGLVTSVGFISVVIQLIILMQNKTRGQE